MRNLALVVLATVAIFSGLCSATALVSIPYDGSLGSLALAAGLVAVLCGGVFMSLAKMDRSGPELVPAMRRILLGGLILGTGFYTLSQFGTVGSGMGDPLQILRGAVAIVVCAVLIYLFKTHR